MVEQMREDYDRAFDLAVIGLKKVPGDIHEGELTLQQRSVVRDALLHEGAGRQDRAYAFEQVAIITGDDFFLKAARRALGGQGSQGMSISTRRF